MTEQEIIDALRTLVRAEKIGEEPTGWRRDEGSEQFRNVIPLSIAAVERGRARLVLRAVAADVDRNVTASLVVTVAGVDYVAWRADWRPRQPHTNTVGPPELRGLTVESGVHEFEPNIRLGLTAMRSKLPLCTPMEPEPHDVDAFFRWAVISCRSATPSNRWVRHGHRAFRFDVSRSWGRRDAIFL